MSLQGCVASLSASCNILESSLSTLDSGISDFPRLCHVLQSTRHFELLPESEVLKAQHELRGEIGPQRQELLRRAEKALQVLERREYSLKSKKELQEVRLQQRPSSTRPVTDNTATTVTSSAGRGAEIAGSDAEEQARAERLRISRSKKERLAYTLKRLQMEEQGRKNRMSLAPGGFGL